MTGVSLRRAAPGDLDSLLAIEAASFTSDRISRRQMRYMIGNPKALLLVAVLEDAVIGYGLILLPRLPRPARLYSLAVKQAFRGRKVAQGLLQSLLQTVRKNGYVRIRLEVRASQGEVQALYQRFGFAAIARLPAYYGDGEAAMRMELRLDEAPAFPPLEGKALKPSDSAEGYA